MNLSTPGTASGAAHNAVRVAASLVTMAALVLSLFGFSHTANAALGINKQIPFEGYLKMVDGFNVPDGPYDMVFDFYQSPTGGASIWTGTYTGANAVTVASSSFQVLLGSGAGNAIDNDNVVDFNDDQLYVEVTISGEVMSPRYRIGAAAYAFNSDMLDGYHYSDFILGGDATSNTVGDIMQWDGTAWVPVATSAVGSDEQDLTSATLAGTILTVAIENGASTSVDLAALQGSATDETITAASFSAATDELTITEAGTTYTVDLSDLANTDAQALSYDAATNVLTLVNGGTVDLSGLNDSKFVDGNTATDAVYTAGNVGIGTTDPESRLNVVGVTTVAGSIDAGTLIIKRSNATAGAGFLGVVAFNDVNNDVGPEIIAVDTTGVTDASDADLRFFTGGAGDRVNRLTIQGTTGNVGIGTANPSVGDETLKLDVAGAIGASAYCDANGNNCSTAGELANAVLGDRDWLAVGTNEPPTTVTNSIYTEGRVGIGTNAPATDLHISGTGVELARIESTDSASSSLRFSNTTGSGFVGSSGSGMYISGTGANDPSQLFVSSIGNVGIGTDNPLTDLDVHGLTTLRKATANTGFEPVNQMVVENNADGSEFSRLRMGQNTENNMFIDVADETDTKGNLLLQPFGGSGRVGIGTTAPISALDVNGNTTLQGNVIVPFVGTTGTSTEPSEFRVQRNDGSANLQFLWNSTGTIAPTALATGSGFRLTYNAGPGTGSGINMLAAPDVNAGDTQTFVNAMTWAPSGNIGIRDQEPTGILDIGGGVSFTGQGDVNVDADMVLNGRGAIAAEGDFFLNSNSDAGAAGDIVFGSGARGSAASEVTAGDYSEHMRIRNNGNVGIGVVAPTERLHVAGNILASGTITPSDRNLKSDIEEIDDALDKINSIGGYTFIQDGEERAGVIAQELREVLPQAIRDINDGYIGVQYDMINALTIEAIQELDEKIESSQVEANLVASEGTFAGQSVWEAIESIWNTVTGNSDKIETLEDRIEQLEEELDVEAPAPVIVEEEEVVSEEVTEEEEAAVSEAVVVEEVSDVAVTEETEEAAVEEEGVEEAVAEEVVEEEVVEEPVAPVEEEVSEVIEESAAEESEVVETLDEADIAETAGE